MYRALMSDSSEELFPYTECEGVTVPLEVGEAILLRAAAKARLKKRTESALPELETDTTFSAIPDNVILRLDRSWYLPAIRDLLADFVEDADEAEMELFMAGQITEAFERRDQSQLAPEMYTAICMRAATAKILSETA
jgi:hypothetical protein